MRTVLEDARFGLRLIAKRPGAATLLVLILALGIGATTVIFSVADAVLLRPLPYVAPERIYRLAGSGSQGESYLSAPDFNLWRERSRVFEKLAAASTDNFIVLTGAARPEHVMGSKVSREFLPLLGTPPLVGRWFTGEEFRPGSHRAVIISEALWQRQFGRDPALVGRLITLDGEPHTLVGVMPAAFRFEMSKREVWRPLVFSAGDLECRDCRRFVAIGRLRAGVDPRRAEAEARFMTAVFAREAPQAHAGWRATAGPLREPEVEGVRPAMLLLSCAVAFVLLIACVNVANLLLARAAERRSEMAVRAALGAGRGRVLRQLLTESLVVAALGGTAGVVAAYWGVRALAGMETPWMPLPHLEQAAVNGRVLLFATLASLASGLLFSLAPALVASRTDLVETLKESGRGGAGGRRARRARNLLIVFETALSVVLLAGAGLMIRSFARLAAVDPGFREEGILSARVPVPIYRAREKAQQIEYYRGLLARVEQIPGVRQAALASLPPLGHWSFSISFSCQCAPEVRQKHTTVPFRAVSANFFEALGIPVRLGRSFTTADMAVGAPPAVIVNEAMARQLWPNEDPVGKQVTFDTEDNPRWLSVVGMAGNIRATSLQSAPEAEVYVPYSVVLGLPHASLIVRTAGDPARFAPVLRKAIRASYPDQPIEDLSTMRQSVMESVARPRLYTALVALFAGFALLLAAAGMFAVTSYAVAEREREIGIRMALGARAADVLRLAIGQGLKPVGVGLALGMAAAFAACRLLESQLYGVRPNDPVTFAVVPLVLATAALAACWWPARRAARVDPVVALRSE
jgi:putative ABC transport system permease protein